MSAIASRWAWLQVEQAGVSATAHHVLLCLADRYNPKYQCAWPSYPDIVKRTGLSERAVRNAIDQLEDLGLVRRVPKLSSTGRKVGLKYLFPMLDHGLAEEQTRNAFDRATGEYDPEIAAEEAKLMEEEPVWPVLR